MKSLATLGNELYSAKTSIPFVGKRKIWYLIAVVIILGSATLLGTVGLTPGIDFKGGSEITVTGLSSPSERPANEVLSKSDLAAGSSVTTMGSSSVRVQTSELSKQRLDSLAGQLATAYKTDASNVSATTVGPTWSSDVTKKAVRGLVLFFIFVGLLIWAYFRTWKMAAAALLALCHDIIVTVGIYALSGFEVTPATIIGVLTILGYSLYDTVVVFDKIRENTEDFESQSRSTYAELANLAVNQTFIRSINTSVVGVLPVASLLFVGAFILGAGTLRVGAGETRTAGPFPVGSSCGITQEDARVGGAGLATSWTVDGAAAQGQRVVVGIGAKGSTAAVEAVNTYTRETARFAVVKNVEANGAPVPQSFTFTYVCGAGGESRVLTVPGDGTPVESEELPVGTQCALAEQTDAAWVPGHSLSAQI